MEVQQQSTDGFVEFCREVETQIRRIQPKVQLRKVIKNNQTEQVGLDFPNKTGCVTPIIYLEDFYSEYRVGRTMPEIVAEIMTLYHKQDRQLEVRLQYAMKWSFARQRVLCKLINAKKNQELLRHVPHERWLDLALVYFYPVRRTNESCANITINHKILERWEVSSQDLFEQAWKNMEEQIRTVVLPMTALMMNRLEHILCLQEKGVQPLLLLEPTEGENMYVITNQFQMFGAVGILNDSVLERLANHFEEDLIVLPSSIHECIIVPYHEKDVEHLKRLVLEMNRSNVAAPDVLSDSIYIYRKALHKIECISSD
ncbi:MAG: DUF5688 family protein [Lachnospiraceae bacterium]|nr:DUF5688 family protein [Lachnospiraceae bacterium]MDY5742625.1 DUF5688 family protein [Lachnospiraceae bacterium]